MIAWIAVGLLLWFGVSLPVAIAVGLCIGMADNMARKAAHDQRSTPPSFVCMKCKDGECNQCIDIMRVVVLELPQICYCKRRDHSGEARDKQIVDPETGTVYGPGLRVTKEGEVLNGGYDNGGGRDPGHG